jgi:hypothetical protein
MDSVCPRALLQVEGRPAYVSIQSDKTDFKKVADELKILTQLGYTSFQAIQQTTLHRQVVPHHFQERAEIEHVFQRGSSELFGKYITERSQTLDQVTTQYKKIFASYGFWGEDYGLAHRLLPLKVVRNRTSNLRARRLLNSA